MSHAHIGSQLNDGILSLTMNRPDRRNALTLAMYRHLSVALRAAESDAAVRVVLLSGSKNYFTAGNDLSEFVGYKKGGEFVALTFLKSLHALNKPLVAAVEGGAIGVGATMLQHCDFVYAAKGTRFSLPFIQFGLCAEGGSSLLLAQGSAARQVARWLMLGDPFTADEAFSAGLVTEVVPDGCALQQAQAVAARLAQVSPEALRTTKSLIKRARGNVEAILVEEIDHFTSLLEGHNAQEALRRFTTRSK